MEPSRRADGEKSIALQSAGDAEGKGFSENGTAGFLRRSVDHEARHSGHSTVFGACFVAEPRALGVEWIPSDLSFIRGA